VARVAGAGVAAAELADAEVFGLNKSPNVGLEGDAEGAGLAAASVFAFLRLRLAAGEAEVAGDAFGLRGRFPAGEGEAAASAAGEAALVASAFLCARCFAGDGDAAGDPPGVGDLPCTRQMLARPIKEMSARNLVVITCESRKATGL
jgi:hypothetical protein